MQATLEQVTVMGVGEGVGYSRRRKRIGEENSRCAQRVHRVKTSKERYALNAPFFFMFLTRLFQLQKFY
jgi:hypothetical protein